MAYGANSKEHDAGRSPGDIVEVPVGAINVYQGTLTSIDPATGLLAVTQKTASARFAGVARETVKNSGGTAGAVRCSVWRKGVYTFKGTGFAQTDVGKEVWASTETADAQSTVVVSDPGATATKVGVIVEYISATAVRVCIDGYAFISAADGS